MLAAGAGGLHVILLNQYYPPAEAPTGTLLADVGRALAARGHRVTVICSNRDYSDPSRRFPSRETGGVVEIRRVPTTGFGRTGRLGRVLDYLSFMLGAALRLAFAPRADWIVALTTPPLVAVPARVLGGLRGAKVAYWVMDVYPQLAFELGVLRRGSPVGWAFGALAGWILRRAHRVVAIGELMAEHLQRAGAADVTVVHNWIDGETVRPRPVADHPMRREMGWGDRFVVLYSGNLGLAHDFETVLEAAGTLAERDPGVRFVFAGSGARQAALRRAVERRGLGNVEFRPWVPHERLGESLTSADLHLVTLKDGVEGLLVPSKIYGILAAGRPTLFVGPERGEIPSILADGPCGLRVPVGDAVGLVQAIEGYRRAPERVHREGAAAREKFDREFDREVAVGRFVALLDAEGPSG